MENDSILFFGLLLMIIAVCIWLILQVKKERARFDLLSKENTKLIADNALLLNEHLKFQLQPHTLNSILANLKVFSNKLNKGLDSLSATLTYILYSGEKSLVSIEDEIRFIKKYLELNDLFTDEIDSITLDDSQVSPTSQFYTTACIPHLITAYFIENAFKHGDVHHPQFLKIEITLSNRHFALRVVNRIRKKPLSVVGGIGLKNMKERLDLLLPEKYEIERTVADQYYETSLKIYF